MESKHFNQIDELINSLPIELPQSFKDELTLLMETIYEEAWDAGFNEAFECHPLTENL